MRESAGEKTMGDLREFSFGDWLKIFFRAVPALLLVQLALTIPIAVLLAMFWLVIPIGR